MSKIIEKSKNLFVKKKEDKKEKPKRTKAEKIASFKNGAKVFFTWFCNIFCTLFLIGVITGAIVGAALLIYIKNYVDPTFDIDNLKTSSSLTTSLYYTNAETGEAVELEGDRLYVSENRLWASFNEIPKNLVNAFVSIEDKRFFEHNGVDWKRTAGAVVYYFLPGKHFGGSTITQQLIKNVTGDDDVTIQRKIQEILRALDLETKRSKEEILEMYLNTIYLSQGCNGVQAAANEYFNKDVSELTLTECAALASITKYPTKYDPKQNPENNKKRRNDILYEMEAQGMITVEERDEAVNTELVLYEPTGEGESKKDNSYIHSYFIDAVIDSVINDLMEEKGVTKTVASQMVFSGGLKIYTTLDPYVQSCLEDVYVNDKTLFTDVTGVKPQSAMVIMDYKNGEVKGLVGGFGEKKLARGLNRATQAVRQCGSAIKPLSVYAPAIEYGYVTYSTLTEDSPFTVDEATGKGWPKNADNRYDGYMDIVTAVAKSKNTIAVKTLAAVTPEASYKFMTEKLHFSTLVESKKNSSGKVFSDIGYAQLALGGLTDGVTTLEMCAAYCVFPSGGVYSEPRLYTKILDSENNVVIDNSNKRSVVISEETASIMTKMLTQVTDWGTAKMITLKNSVPCAGKTGTTTNKYDLYYCGYTPYYCGAVWFGYDQARYLKYTTNPAVYLWDKVMTKVHQPIIDSGAEIEKFETPSSVKEYTYCTETGKVATSKCPNTKIGYATHSTMPEVCTAEH